MYQKISFSQFCDAFRDMGRSHNFSYEGRRAIFDYLEDLEESCEQEIELDVIAICCEFSEYKSAREAAKDLGCSLSCVEENIIFEDDSLVIVRGF